MQFKKSRQNVEVRELPLGVLACYSNQMILMQPSPNTDTSSPTPVLVFTTFAFTPFSSDLVVLLP